MRIALLGGTFDPIHNGHLAAAHSVSAAFRIDEVHFVPSFSPPHKQSRPMTSAFHRFAMVALATLPIERFRPSAIEVDTKEKRYTVDTLDEMGRLYPETPLLFVLGTDMYQEIETWKDYRRLFDLAHLVIVSRPGFPFREDVSPFETLREGQVVLLSEKDTSKKRVFHLPYVQQPIAATEIRDRCRRGDDVHGWLPAPVWNYIQKNKLYS